MEGGKSHERKKGPLFYQLVAGFGIFDALQRVVAAF
jgi:hypothetical protein